MSVKVRAWKGAWWSFIDDQGRRKTKRLGEGKEGQKAVLAAAEKIQVRLVLGDLSLLEESGPREGTLKEYAEQWLATDVALRLKPGTVEKYREVFRNAGCRRWVGCRYQPSSETTSGPSCRGSSWPV